MAKNKNILILNYEYPPLGGGAANATKYLLKEFSKQKGLKVDLITSSVGKYRVEEFSKNIHIHFLDIGKNNENIHFQKNKDLLKYSWKAYFYSKKLLKNQNFDLVHAFFGIPCGYLALKLKLPYIVSLRGSDVPFYNQRFKLLDKLVFKRLSKKVWRRSEFVVANSEGLKKLALESSPKQKIEVIYNGVDTQEFNVKKNKKVKRPIKLISTGRLIKRKGYNYLVGALRNLGDDFSLTLAGGGDEKDSLKLLAKELKVKVKFLGEVDHKKIALLLKEADIFVLPSLNEGMSNSVLEAMACGLPIIATNTGGSKELLNKNGMMVAKKSKESLKGALDKYIKNKQLIEVHGKKSREIAESLSWSNVAEKYQELYRRF